VLLLKLIVAVGRAVASNTKAISRCNGPFFTVNSIPIKDKYKEKEAGVRVHEH